MKTKLSIAITAALISSAAMASSEFTANQFSPEITSVDHYKKSQFSHSAISSPQRFIVELESPAIAKYQGGVKNLTATASKKGQRVDTQSAPAISYANHLQSQQQAFKSSLSKIAPNAKVERNFKTLFNGVTLVGQGLTLEQLTAMPGVKSVYPETMYEINMDASHEVINSVAMWEAVSGIENAGKDVRVAIIDTGIRPENPMFSGEGFTKPTANMPTNDYCSSVDTTFCNDKLIVARWSQPTFKVCADEHLSPLGYGGHGSHVAGTSVGNKITTTFKDIEVELSGVAPAAYLMVYKALFTKDDCSGGSGSNIMLMEALEHAVNDGADVINNSWGGGAGGDPANSPYKTMFEAAEAAGVVVVTAAGNDGNGAQTIGCPGCIESGITVANSTTGRFFANGFTAGGNELLAIEANNEIQTEDITLPVIAAVNIDAENTEACSAFPADSFKDSIALISRGACAFSVKAANAEAAGAKAIVVYNNKPGAPISMYMPDATLPGVMISNADGAAVLEGLGDNTTGTIGAKVKRITSNALADLINASSSRGPNGNQNILKPDLAAPGTDILSATSPDEDGTDFATMTGTSMASPHVAGAAALMKQLHPEWSANDIKTALTSTAHMSDILDDDAETQASPFVMGAGRMDLDAAAKAVLTFDKPSVASDSCVGPCTFTRTVYNKSDEATSWTLSASADSAGISVSPSTLELEAGASAEFTVTVDSTFTEYGSWIFGNVMIKSDQGKQDAHLPVAIMARESSDSSLISAITTKADIKASDEFPIKAIVNNSIFEKTVTITAYAPQGTKITSTDITPNLTGAQQNGFDVNLDLGRITWVGTLDLPQMSSTKDVGGFPSLIADLGVTPEICEAGCDETAITFSSLPSFKYNGVSYDSITMGDNGIAIVGGGSTSGTYANKELPDSANPNNILAPFWSDFDLADTSGTDTGGGQMAMGVFNGANDTVWLALEWKDAQLYADDTNTKYSFSIWIKAGEEEQVIFNYLDIPNMPAAVTIGAENIGGSVGTTFHHNSQGESVTSGDAVMLQSTAPGSVKVDYMVKATSFNYGQMDTVKTDEEKDVELNVLDNDTVPEKKVARVSITGDGITANAQRLIHVSADGALGKVMLVTEPENGKVTLAEDGAAVYTPNKDFFGEDSFTYSSEDAAGNTSTPAKVTVTVNNINDAPTVSPSAASSIVNTPITIASNAKDVDGDDLTFTWTQTSGDTVSFNSTDENIKVTAATSGTYTFEVVASDGVIDSKAGEVTLTVSNAPDNSGGSLGWLTMLLLPFAGLRRRKR
ncbi:S8 family serine peptidase [Shewanella violacea]|uniref:Serine protease, subtilase family n=1 Tax=Shewanella violacea (strain JCM 10179 / CIP 106290 / LMG 19151 / DSS12) TaxID=637905 RepID=D4ZC19_SHEVD|nr:S8 family serine peptidase [Shewanella violacea]BAJ03564.1 serine protease, subtilase family [Shewanella violacea DSS12]